MGGSLFFFVESKSFEFSVEEGGSFFLLRIFERGRDSLRSVFMGKECAKRLLSIMENFIFSEPREHFACTIRVGETVFILQSGSNAHGYYLMISELLHGRRKGFLVIPEGRMGHGWRGFVWHLKKVLAPGNHALNMSPIFLPGSELRANTSYAVAVVQDRRSEPKAHRLAAEEFPLTQDSCDQANPHLSFLNSCNPSSANLDSQTQDSRKSCLGKEKDLIGLQLPIVSFDGTEGELLVDLHLRLVRGPLGTWEISWSNVTEVDSSLNQPPNPKSSDSLKPKPPTISQLKTSKPISNSKPKHPIVGQHSSSQPILNSKPKPISNMKPKPISNTKPKPISNST